MRSRLTQRIEIQAKTSSRSASGAVSESWVTRETRHAHVEALRANERVEAERTVGSNAYRIEIRYHATLTSADRIVWNGQVLEIDGVQHDTSRRRRYITRVTCTAVAGEVG